ncbi:MULTISPECIES: hypothetical protein [Micromonospora]|uniref:hypothetical protein n=1 Tax=Micromonospora TaxID=1873 RepID=UPI0006AEDF6A|nr:hypothetical protein [Micromonospora sp. NRRL B-16802]
MLTTPRALVLLLPLLTMVACASPRDAAAPAEGGTTPLTPTVTPTPPPTDPSASGETTPPAPPSLSATNPPLSSTVPPTMRPPAAKPSPPSDLRQTDLISGTITQGGTGPCYRLVSEDGTEYALHGPDAGELRTGSFVTLRIGPARARISCGPGLARSIIPE